LQCTYILEITTYMQVGSMLLRRSKSMDVISRTRKRRLTVVLPIRELRVHL
jgi:hypothetical protein